MFLQTNPKPSSEVSNSTNAGVTADPCRRMSWGVVMDTRHLTRVRGTVLPSADRTRLRLMRYWPLSSAGVVNTLSGPKPSMDMVMLSVRIKGKEVPLDSEQEVVKLTSLLPQHIKLGLLIVPFPTFHLFHPSPTPTSLRVSTSVVKQSGECGTR